MVSEEAYEPQFGARPLKRFVQRQIETPLARMMIKEGMPEGTVVNVDLDDNHELTFDVQKPEMSNECLGKPRECDEHFLGFVFAVAVYCCIHLPYYSLNQRLVRISNFSLKSL